MTIVNEESLQTSNDEIILDTPNGEEDTTGNSETSGDDNAEETHGDEGATESAQGEDEPGSQEIDYKVKFSESSREAQRLLDEVKRLTAENEQFKDSRVQLETDLEDAKEVLKQTNPEAYNFKTLEKSVKDIEKNLALSKENESLNQYLTQNPGADAIKESLRVLGRQFPTLSYDELWKQHYEPVVTKTTTDVQAKKALKKASSPETGKGSPTSDLAGDVDDKDFNKKTLNERKAILKKKGY